MLEKIDHIGIAVHSLEQRLPYYTEALGLTAGEVEEISSQQVRVVSLQIGEVSLELLEPTSEESPIAKFIAKRGEGIHHIAFATDNIHAQLSQARRCGCDLIHEEPFAGAGQKLVAFLHPRSTGGVLTELCTKAARNYSQL